MENAGVEDLLDASLVERRGIGTSSTRAATLEALVKRGYVERVKKNLIPTSGGYTFTLLAVVSGDDISDMPYYNDGELTRDRTYGIIAVQNADGSPITAEPRPDFFATPLVKGEKPWEVNAMTLGGGYSETMVDGVLYRVVECDNVMQYANKGLYFAVCTDMFISNATSNFNEATGEISVNPNYGGASAVFELPIDD